MVDHPLESNIVHNISAVIEDGYVPVGYDETEIAGWRIHQIPVEELDTAFGILEGYRNRGFLPYGVSINQETVDFWFLMVQLEGWEDDEPASIAFNAFPLDETEAGMTENVENGLHLGTRPRTRDGLRPVPLLSLPKN
jgi:hypothetical protein